MVSLGLGFGFVLVLGLVLGLVPLPEQPKQFLVTPDLSIEKYVNET